MIIQIIKLETKFLRIIISYLREIGFKQVGEILMLHFFEINHDPIADLTESEISRIEKIFQVCADEYHIKFDDYEIETAEILSDEVQNIRNKIYESLEYDESELEYNNFKTEMNEMNEVDESDDEPDELKHDILVSSETEVAPLKINLIKSDNFDAGINMLEKHNYHELAEKVKDWTTNKTDYVIPVPADLEELNDLLPYVFEEYDFTIGDIKLSNI